MQLNVQPEEFLLLSLPQAYITLSPPSLPTSSQPPTSQDPFSPTSPEPTPRSLDVICVAYPTPSSTPLPPPLPPRPGTSTPVKQPEPERENLLLLRLGPPPPSGDLMSFDAPSKPPAHEQDIPILPGSTVQYDANARTFHFPATEPPLSVGFGEPMTEQDALDQETFQLLLRDYASLQPYSPPSNPTSTGAAAGEERGEPPAYDIPPNARSQLLVVDEDSGAVLGEVDTPHLHLTEAPEFSSADPQGPVVVTLPSSPPPGTPSGPLGKQEQEEQVTEVRPAETEEEFELIMRGATLLSRAIQGATNALAGGIGYAAQLYVSHVPPDPKGPTKLSPQAREAVERVHQVSGSAVRVTAKTTGVVHRFIDRAIDKAGTAASSLRPPPDPSAPPPPKTAWREATRIGGRLAGKVLQGADMLLTTLESSGAHLIDSTTDSLSRSLEHRYGSDVGEATRTVGETVRNVGVVYVDARGVTHRALLKRAGVRAVKVTMRREDGRRVRLEEEAVAGGRLGAGAEGREGEVVREALKGVEGDEDLTKLPVGGGGSASSTWSDEKGRGKGRDGEGEKSKEKEKENQQETHGRPSEERVHADAPPSYERSMSSDQGVKGRLDNLNGLDEIEGLD